MQYRYVNRILCHNYRLATYTVDPLVHSEICTINLIMTPSILVDWVHPLWDGVTGTLCSVSIARIMLDGAKLLTLHLACMQMLDTACIQWLLHSYNNILYSCFINICGSHSKQGEFRQIRYLDRVFVGQRHSIA